MPAPPGYKVFPGPDFWVERAAVSCPLQTGTVVPYCLVSRRQTVDKTLMALGPISTHNMRSRIQQDDQEWSRMWCMQGPAAPLSRQSDVVLCFDASLPRAICGFIPLFVQRDICCLPLPPVGVHSETDAFPPSGSSCVIRELAGVCRLRI